MRKRAPHTFQTLWLHALRNRTPARILFPYTRTHALCQPRGRPCSYYAHTGITYAKFVFPGLRSPRRFVP
eukprot:5010682-Pleurochrysis_carterae.AAC.1